MRAVLVNHLHPETKHVGAVRMREFARALAARGHSVILLTQGGETGNVGGPDPAGAAALIAGHDWSRPLMLGCPPRVSRLPPRDSLPRPLRRGLIAWSYLVRGGVFSEWTDATRPWWPVLAEHFRPDVVWGTFGNTDCWVIAQGIARVSGCPWVADIKDSWDTFIPAPFRALLAHRFSDCALVTGLSEGHLRHTGRRFPLRRPRRAIYSGFPATLLNLPDAEEPPRRITITGSLYADAGAEGLAEGIRLWLDEAGTEAAGVTVTYAGGDRERMTRAAARLAGKCRLELHDFLPLEDLARLQREAFINLYARHTGSADSFHHKLMELMVAGRPAACLPAELPEAEALAAAVGGKLASCADSRLLAPALAEAWAERMRPPRRNLPALTAFTWEGQAERLETALNEAIAAGSPHCRLRVAQVLAWTWVVGVASAYLRQFLDLAPALRRVLGW